MGTGLANASVPTDAPIVISDKVTICHADSDNKKPYVVITPAADGNVSGHADHTGPVWSAGLKADHIDWGDIIPPFYYDNGDDGISFYPGLN